VLLAFSGMALAQTPGAGPGQGQMGQGKMMQGMQMPQMMEPMSQGKLSPEDPKKMADILEKSLKFSNAWSSFAIKAGNPGLRLR